MIIDNKVSQHFLIIISDKTQPGVIDIKAIKHNDNPTVCKNNNADNERVFYFFDKNFELYTSLFYFQTCHHFEIIGIQTL